MSKKTISASKTMFLIATWLVFGIVVADQDLRSPPSVSVFHQLLHTVFDANSGPHPNHLSVNKTKHVIHELLESFGCKEKEVCENCTLTASALFTIVGKNDTGLAGLTESDFQKASVVMLYFLIDLNRCRSLTDPAAKSYKSYHADIFDIFEHGGSNMLARIEHVLNHVKNNYKPEHHNEVNDHHHHEDEEQCFSSETVAKFANVTKTTEISVDKVDEIVATIILRLFQGYNLQSECEDHDALPNKEDFLSDVYRFLGVEDKGSLSEEKFKELLEKLKIGSGNSEKGHDDHAVHDHRRRRDVSRRSQRKRRESEHVGEKENKTRKCFNADQMFHIFSVNESVGVTRQQFSNLCPTLIQQQITGVCTQQKTESSKKTSDAEKYGYGSLAVLIISLCSLLGVCLGVCKHYPEVHRDIIIVFTSLAVGTLIGDALLHLMPQALGLHLHEPGETHETEGISIPTNLWRQLVVVGAIYAFLLLEMVMNTGRNSSHGNDEKHQSHSGCQAHSHLDHLNTLDMAEKNTTPVENKKVFCGLSSVALMITMGDLVHNLADGLAIGAAFSFSVSAGLSTSIAVFCHELPHELGDFAILISTGLSYKKALALNFFSACSAFVGLYIGIAVSVNVEVQQWIFAIAAGMFLYVALVDMSPELVHYFALSPCKHFILVNIGFLIGLAILVLIAIFEEQIKVIAA